MATLTVAYRNEPGATEAVKNIVERNGGTGWSVDANPEDHSAVVTATATTSLAMAQSIAEVLSPERSGVVQSVEVTE